MLLVILIMNIFYYKILIKSAPHGGCHTEVMCGKKYACAEILQIYWSDFELIKNPAILLVGLPHGGATRKSGVILGPDFRGDTTKYL